MKTQQDNLYEPRIFPNVTKEALDEISNFKSVTETATQASTKGLFVCPSCGTRINFNEPIEWFGSSFFACTGCQRILHMNIIARALRNLGYVQ